MNYNDPNYIALFLTLSLGILRYSGVLEIFLVHYRGIWWVEQKKDVKEQQRFNTLDGISFGLYLVSLDCVCHSFWS